MSLSRSCLRRFTVLLFVFTFLHLTRPIVVPQTYSDVYEKKNKSGHRRLIIESLLDEENQREEFLTSIPCINSFLEKYVHRPDRISFVAIDNEESIQNIVQSFVRSLYNYSAFFKHTVDLDFETHESALSTIVLMQNANSLEDNHYILEPCDRACPFITILISSFQDEESFLEHADVVMQSMWSRRIATVVILAKVGDSVLAAGSLTFQPGKICTVSPPVILDKCEGNSWSKLKHISAPKTNGCVLKVAYFEQSPYVIVGNDSKRLSGFEGALTEEALRGQEIEREKVVWNDNTSYAEQVQMYIYNDINADFVIGRILQQSYEDIDYSSSYDTSKVVWLVPKVPNVSLKGLVQPFQQYVWAAVGGSILLGCVVKIFLFRDLSFLDIFALIIGVSTARQPTRLSTKIHFLAWCIFGLFLTQLYVDSLADQLINMSDLKLETMKELISSSFQIGGTAAFARLFEIFDQDEIVESVRKKFVIFDQDAYLKQYYDLLDGTNSSFALVIVLNSSRSDAIETTQAYTITTDVICSFPLALATWKGSPYLEHLNEEINKYIDFGILDFLIQSALEKNLRAMLSQTAQDEEYKTELHLQQFVPAFLLVAIGFSSGFLFIILEVVLYPSKLLQ